MSIDSLRKMLTAQGSFPDEPAVRGNFEALFAMAATSQESAADLAWAFLQALDQMSNVQSALDDDLAQRLQAWVEANWSSEPLRFCEQLAAIAVNVASSESLAFLKARREESTDEATQTLLDDLVRDHPVSRAAAAAGRTRP